MKNYLINKTQRESILYSNFQELKYLLGKILNIQNYILRKKRIKQYLKENEFSKVQFGAGSGKLGEADKTSLSGYLDTDIFGKVPIDINYKLPFENNCLDIIFNSHLIEHIYQRKAALFLKETFRVLKNGGSLITATPTYSKIFEALYGDDKYKKQLIYENHKSSINNRKPTPARIINCLSHINYGHKFIFDYETFYDLANSAGFKNIKSISLDEIEDKEIKTFLNNKDDAFKIQTEIFLASKY